MPIACGLCRARSNARVSARRDYSHHAYHLGRDGCPRRLLLSDPACLGATLGIPRTRLLLLCLPARRIGLALATGKMVCLTAAFSAPPAGRSAAPVAAPLTLVHRISSEVFQKYTTTITPKSYDHPLLRIYRRQHPLQPHPNRHRAYRNCYWRDSNSLRFVDDGVRIFAPAYLRKKKTSRALAICWIPDASEAPNLCQAR